MMHIPAHKQTTEKVCALLLPPGTCPYPSPAIPRPWSIHREMAVAALFKPPVEMPRRDYAAHP